MLGRHLLCQLSYVRKIIWGEAKTVKADVLDGAPVGGAALKTHAGSDISTLNGRHEPGCLDAVCVPGRDQEQSHLLLRL